MTSDDIYALLATKPHNPHYLKRYVKFIFSCTHQTGEYVEKHHICPKAKDLFPEYKSFRKYPWNKVYLTARQHILAHVLLWKTFSGSQIFALNCMLDHFNSSTNPWLKNRIVPLSTQIRYLAKIRKEKSERTSIQHKGKSSYKDNSGNKYYLNIDDPLIQELNLVGNNAGIKFSDETKHLLRNCNRKTATVQLYFLDSKIKVRYNLNPELYASLIDQGWLPYLTKDDRQYIRRKQGKKCSNKLTGTTRYCYPDGTYYGRISKDDPAIEELNLILQRTENMTNSNRCNQKKAAERNTGTKIYNNGVVQVRSKEHPGEGWTLGMLERSESHRKNHKQSVSKSRRGTFVVNDGVRNKYLKIDEPVPDGYSIGMAPRVQR